MPTLLSGGLPDTLADLALLKTVSPYTTQRHNGQDYAVFKDGSCLALFNGKLGHAAGLFEGDEDIAWYPQCALTLPRWVERIKTSTYQVFPLIDPIRAPLLQLLGGTGERVSLHLASGPCTRDGKGKLTAKLEGVYAEWQDLLTETLNKVLNTTTNISDEHRALSALTPGWKPGTPLVTSLHWATLSFSNYGKKNSTHAFMNDLETFLETH